MSYRDKINIRKVTVDDASIKNIKHLKGQKCKKTIFYKNINIICDQVNGY